jgi:hypothetical protein
LPWAVAVVVLALGALAAATPAAAQELPYCSAVCLGPTFPFCSTQCLQDGSGAQITCGDVTWQCLPDVCQNGHFADSGVPPRLVGQWTKLVNRRIGGIPRQVSVVVNLWAAGQYYVHDPSEGNCTEPDNCDRLYTTDGCTGTLNGGNWGSMACHAPTGADQARCTIQF